MKKIRALALSLIIVFATVCVGASAADQTARLKSGLQDKPLLYYSISSDILTASWTAAQTAFTDRYDEMNVAVTGMVKNDSVSSVTHQITLYSPSGRSFTVSSSELDSSVTASLKAGDNLTVYGKISVTPVLRNSYKITADHAVINPTFTLTGSEYYMYPDKLYKATLINDMAGDRHVSMLVPETWLSDYVCTPLTNNAITGHQFNLNAIPPRNTEYPEIFYIFYFDNETYLEKPPANPTDGDYKDIETAIVKNILEELDDNFKINITDLESGNGHDLHYCMTTYKPTDGRDYRLEFLFLPDSDGVTVMLYLYYPRLGASAHLEDVICAIETLETGH